MEKSNDSPKRPCHRCDDCKELFDDAESWEKHKKTACQRQSAPVSPAKASTVDQPEQALDAEYKVQTLLNTVPAADGYFVILARKKSAFEAMKKAREATVNATQDYSSAMAMRETTYKAMKEAIERERTLSTWVTPEEHRIISDVKERAVSAYKEASAAEERVLMTTRDAINEQAMATNILQAASAEVCDALITIMESKEVQENPVLAQYLMELSALDGGDLAKEESLVQQFHDELENASETMDLVFDPSEIAKTTVEVMDIHRPSTSGIQRASSSESGNAMHLDSDGSD